MAAGPRTTALPPAEEGLSVAFMNCRGQTGFSSAKKAQIEGFLRKHNINILQMQEVDTNHNTFSMCPLIASSFRLIPNNSPSKYGTASLIHNDINVSNVQFDGQGRIIIFEALGATFGNVYLPSGSTAVAQREEYSSTTLPQLLLNRRDDGIIGGDWNCIVEKRDASYLPGNKVSPSLARLVRHGNWEDCYRALHPAGRAFSRYYTTEAQGQGSTRIDRAYSWGPGLQVLRAEYVPLAFSDHHALVVRLGLPAPAARLLSPRARPLFKARPEVIKDPEFKRRLQEALGRWRRAREAGLDILTCWEEVIKPGIKKLALERGKELNWERRGQLNLLFLRQAHLSRRLQAGEQGVLAGLLSVQADIQTWYEEASARVILQARTDDCDKNEKVRLYHHELHKKRIVRSSILRLTTEAGMLEGHEACAAYLEGKVAELLQVPLPPDPAAEEELLAEVRPVFTAADNALLEAPPSARELREVVRSAHHLAAPGTDGLPSLLYSVHWDLLGPALLEVVGAIHAGSAPTASQRTSIMVFGSKPKHLGSTDPAHKRRISLINADKKLVTGLEAKRFNRTATHTLSPVQLVAGADRRLHHGICRARDAVIAAGRGRDEVGFLDHSGFGPKLGHIFVQWIS